MLLWAQAASLRHRATVGAVRDTQGPPGRGQSRHRREDRTFTSTIRIRRSAVALLHSRACTARQLRSGMRLVTV
ncbi:Trinucleotide Repeat-Containing 18 Protein [Manis pentadactyla]|nr:Trinucleotide Repeat-Containing 18 Protein [Manis pentadactyla]